MKTNFRFAGPAELELPDLGEILLHWAKKSGANKKALSKMITEYLVEELQMSVKRLDISKDLRQIIAQVEQHSSREGKPKPYSKEYKGFRKNTGFYTIVADVITECKLAGKDSITFEELTKEVNKVLKTLKKGSKDISRVRQYLSPSQIVKNAPITLKGVIRDKNDEGLTW